MIKRKHKDKRLVIDPKLSKSISDLIKSVGDSPYEPLLKEIIATTLKLRDEEIERPDVKMINAVLRDWWYALKVFYAYRHVRKVAIFGSARTPRESAAYQQAKEFARHIVKAGWMVITGASSGIMNAGNEGAGRANSFGVNIQLPFEQFANPVIENDSKLMSFKYFFIRKLIFVRESDATLLCPGGFGTHDEGFETLTLIQTGKTTPRPVVCLDPPRSTYWENWRDLIENQMVKRGMLDKHDLNLIHFTHDPKEAAEVIAAFYRNYHSMRFIYNRLVLRIKKPLPPKKLAELNGRFKDILVKGKIEQFARPFEEEANDPYTLDFPRLAMYFNRRHFSRLKEMIDIINRA